MQTFISIPNKRSSHSIVEASSRKSDLDALETAVLSLKDDCLKPTEQQVRARMRDSGVEELDERLLNLVQKVRNYQLMYEDGSIVIYPPSGKFESYDPNILLPEVRILCDKIYKCFGVCETLLISVNVGCISERGVERLTGILIRAPKTKGSGKILLCQKFERQRQLSSCLSSIGQTYLYGSNCGDYAQLA